MVDPRVVIGTAGRAPLDGHLWHVIGLGAWVPLFALIVLVERVRQRRRDGQQRGVRARATPIAAVTVSEAGALRWPQAMVVSSVCAALVHVAVMPGHFQQSIWYGLFFLAVSLGQLCFAIGVLARPGPRLVVAGMVGSALVVVLWLVSRTIGVPIGPDNGGTEPFGVLDTLASVAEVAIVTFGALTLRSRQRPSAWRWTNWSLVMRFVTPACVAGTVLLSFVASRS